MGDQAISDIVRDLKSRVSDLETAVFGAKKEAATDDGGEMRSDKED